MCRYGFRRSCAGIKHPASLCHFFSSVGVSCFYSWTRVLCHSSSSVQVSYFPLVKNSVFVHQVCAWRRRLRVCTPGLWLAHSWFPCFVVRGVHSRTRLNHAYHSVSSLTLHATCPSCIVLSRVYVLSSLLFVVAPGEFRLLPEEEESDGDMNMVGPGRSSGLGHTDEDPNLWALHKSSQFGSWGEKNFNSQATIPFHVNQFWWVTRDEYITEKTFHRGEEGRGVVVWESEWVGGRAEGGGRKGGERRERERGFVVWCVWWCVWWWWCGPGVTEVSLSIPLHGCT